MQEVILEVGASATFASYLIGFFKMGLPNAPKWTLALVVVLAGIVISYLAQISMHGELVDLQGHATTILQGLGAAATAGGINATNKSGDKVRTQGD